MSPNSTHESSDPTRDEPRTGEPADADAHGQHDAGGPREGGRDGAGDARTVDAESLPDGSGNDSEDDSPEDAERFDAG